MFRGGKRNLNRIIEFEQHGTNRKDVQHLLAQNTKERETIEETWSTWREMIPRTFENSSWVDCWELVASVLANLIWESKWNRGKGKVGVDLLGCYYRVYST